MRTVLVALDGTDFSASILEDALRLAGPGGSLVLVHEVRKPQGRAANTYNPEVDTEEAREDLNRVAEVLRTRGVSVRVTVGSTSDVPAAIEDVARANGVDLIACATHSRGALGTLLRGSIAWEIVSESPVPVLLSYPTSEGQLPRVDSGPRRILVPLDGSPSSEAALVLAQELAAEWRAQVDLVQVIGELSSTNEEREAREYLARIANGMSGEVHCHVLIGSPVVELVAFARAANVTYIVMSSHKRAGWGRGVMGSVSHDIPRLVRVPTIVVPSLPRAA
jgi:nucleotide-binding universal stress UspA family protein